MDEVSSEIDIPQAGTSLTVEGVSQPHSVDTQPISPNASPSQPSQQASQASSSLSCFSYRITKPLSILPFGFLSYLTCSDYFIGPTISPDTLTELYRELSIHELFQEALRIPQDLTARPQGQWITLRKLVARMWSLANPVGSRFTSFRSCSCL